MMLTFLAHVKWFTDVSYANQSLTSTEWLFIIIATSVIIVFLTMLDATKAHKKITKQIDGLAKPFRSLVPLIVRLNVALTLLINLADGQLLAQNYEFHNSWSANFATFLFIITIFSIGFGIYARYGAGLLILGYLSLMFTGNIGDALDHFEYIGIGLYLLFRGPGIYSLDYKFKRLTSKLSNWRRYSLPFYKIGIGVSLISLAFSEKLLNPGLAHNFLNSHNWNFLSFLGVSDHNFIIFIGIMELIIGLSLILNLLPRLMIVSVLMVMLLTASLLGLEEVYGHIFAVGIFVAIMVNDTEPLKN